MRIHVLGVLAFSIVTGLAVGILAGTLPGIGAFAVAAVLGSIVVMLWRSQRDREELERGLVPVPIHRVVGDEPPAREPR